MDGDNIGQGRETTRQFLKSNPEVTQRLREQILSRKNIMTAFGEGSDPDMEMVAED